MKLILKIIIAIIFNFAFTLFLIKINQYNFISYILGTIQIGIYLIICDEMDK